MAMISNNHESSAKLSELPAELIMEILQYLTVTRGYLFEPVEEASRQKENAQRVAALHGLTVACRRLNSIATPYLYESITKLGQSSDWRNVDSLLDTIKRKPGLLDLVRYIETDGTKIDVDLGPSMESKVASLTRINYDDYYEEEGGTSIPAFPCVLVLTTLIQLARNLESLAIEGMWHWGVLYDVYCNPGLRDVSLKNVNVYGAIMKISGSATTRFSSALMLLFTSETGGRIKVGNLWMQKSWHSQFPQFSEDTCLNWEELRVIPIEDLDFEGNIGDCPLETMLVRCSSIRRLRCRWTERYHDYSVVAFDLKYIRQCLKHCENTLESLVLIILDFSWLDETDQGMTMIGSLREFTNLKHVEIPGAVLLTDGYSTVRQPRLSTILPSALETIVINIEWDFDIEVALADLAEDLAMHFPVLKKVDCSWWPAPMLIGRVLITKFAEAGVNLKLDIASCIEEDERRMEAEIVRMKQDTEYMDGRAEAVLEEFRRLDEERTGME
jgi:hypothetical protein